MNAPAPMQFTNSPGKQTLLAVGTMAVGAALAYGFRHYDASGLTNSLAGFLLGLLLLGVGLAAFVTTSTQTITIDPRQRRIVVEDNGRFGTDRRIIPFADIVDIRIGFLGKRSNHVRFYYLDLTLRNGTAYPLFAPGRFFDGCADRVLMEMRRQRLADWLAASPGS